MADNPGISSCCTASRLRRFLPLAHQLLVKNRMGVDLRPPGRRTCQRPAMYHTIEFRAEFTVDLEISSRAPLERLLIRKGTRIRMQIKPYVTDTLEGPVEVADLFFENGT